MSDASERRKTGRRLLQLGALLFLLGLLVGFAIPAFAVPRLGLAGHVEGVMNGLFLMALGLMWPQLDLPPRWLRVTYGLALFGTYANVLANVLAAAWGAGSMVPIAASGRTGTPAQEAVVGALLIALALAMVAVSVLMVIGLRGAGRDRTTPEA